MIDRLTDELKKIEPFSDEEIDYLRSFLVKKFIRSLNSTDQSFKHKVAISGITLLLLAILGGIFVLIALSVIIQVGSFKMTGRRVFRMAPLQHHFELKGWAETTIVIRFWLISAMFVALGLGVFYVEWMPK